ncbi:hypothetical protein GCM10009541_25590 [Micromonospora gifhornensis]|uniref:Uncharacterized protein n=1 Tax=Micromonospora gifhornensis TaxID=84594 RepID=A0ABQ4IHS4_9ACTN|nr:hypothetical protein Vgi01_41380 [Micromonospora gifhornensis]
MLLVSLLISARHGVNAEHTDAAHARGLGPLDPQPANRTDVARTTVNILAASARHVRMRCSVRPLLPVGTGQADRPAATAGPRATVSPPGDR